jgi:hypothetical protein
MLKSFETLPEYVNTTDDLLQFAVSSKKTRRVKREGVESRKQGGSKV